jgi:hypothetical protein
MQDGPPVEPSRRRSADLKILQINQDFRSNVAKELADVRAK